LGLAFIDNLGLDVPFATIAALTDGCRIDLMITLQVNDLTRNIGAAFDGTHDPTRVDAFFGTEDWREVVQGARQMNLSPAEIAAGLSDFYGQRLASIGYVAIAESRTVMKNCQNAAQYRLLLAGKHERAVEFFRKIEAINPLGQRGFAFE
jgi:three-Cys-motif partner protein